MKRMFVVAMCLMVCVAMAMPAFAAGKITVNQTQTQGVIQGQASVGGLSASTQGYATGANQSYVIAKTGNPAGVATANTASNTAGGQVKLGNGIQVQGMIGGATNNGGLHW
jgi:hypothetical protein